MKMAFVSDALYKRLAVIEFLVAEKESVGKIHKRLCAVCGSCAVYRSTVGCWVQRVKASGSGEDDESMIRAVRSWLREQEMSWYREGVHALVLRWHKALGEKIFSTPSFRGEVKPSVPCRRFVTCKRSLNLRGSRNLSKITGQFLAHSSTFRC